MTFSQKIQTHLMFSLQTMPRPKLVNLSKLKNSNNWSHFWVLCIESKVRELCIIQGLSLGRTYRRLALKCFHLVCIFKNQLFRTVTWHLIFFVVKYATDKMQKGSFVHRSVFFLPPCFLGCFKSNGSVPTKCSCSSMWSRLFGW